MDKDLEKKALEQLESGDFEEREVEIVFYQPNDGYAEGVKIPLCILEAGDKAVSEWCQYHGLSDEDREPQDVDIDEVYLAD